MDSARDVLGTHQLRGFTCLHSAACAGKRIRTPPPRRILVRAVRKCDPEQIHRMQFSDQLGDLWYGLALGLWYTPWACVLRKRR